MRFKWENNQISLPAKSRLITVVDSDARLGVAGNAGTSSKIPESSMAWNSNFGICLATIVFIIIYIPPTTLCNHWSLITIFIYSTKNLSDPWLLSLSIPLWILLHQWPLIIIIYIPMWTFYSPACLCEDSLECCIHRKLRIDHNMCEIKVKLNTYQHMFIFIIHVSTVYICLISRNIYNSLAYINLHPHV